MPQSQLAGGTKAAIEAEELSSPLTETAPDLDGTPDEPADEPTPADPSAASAVADVTDDEEPSELDADLDGEPIAEEAAEPAPTASGDPAAEPAGEPFTFKADGKQFEIPGAMRYPEGVYIPTEAVARLQEHLADRKSLNGRIRQLEQQVQTGDPERHPEVLKARALMTQLGTLMDQGPEAMAEWLDNLQQNRPILEAKAEAAALKRQLEFHTERQKTESSEAEATALADQMDSALSRNLDAVLADPAIAALNLDRNRLQVRLYRMADALFVEADQDYPEAGVRKGDLAINLELLRAEVNDAAALARQYQGQATQKDKARKLNAPAVNAAAPPPVVTGTKTAAPRDTGRKAPKNREEWEESMRTPIGFEP